MERPPEISFRNLEPSPVMRERIEGEIDKLEEFFDRIIGCRVMMEMRHKRRKVGNTYRVRIDVTVPGKELVVSRDPPGREAHVDPYLAIEDAFRAMCRLLQDHARRMRGQTKAHESPPRGQIAELLSYEGYGFIETSDGREIYFHRNSVLGGAFDRLSVGSEVRFSEEEGIEGPQASSVRLVGERHRRAGSSGGAGPPSP